ncbi:hypothetical protein IX296_000922 [Bacteroides pyogenes]|nr:hypothetical protein [Bacteroides pyogenes]GAE15668.1 hypothetical protein JCM6292_1980 [Bacteroides pyogenes JCM 6292]MBR8738181.1 hypothetical protein [Bacteroides pyogenes]MBR8753852.1 hypothetical protein [Bacteroides pyogenes]MBR8795376.1 hypothetical protein [Bacteroides pyogenes]
MITLVWTNYKMNFNIYIMAKNIFLIFTALLLFSCSENEVDYNKEIYKQEKEIQSKDITGNKELCMQVFSRILSKAVSQNLEVRAFLKEQALKKIDNGYNIFYPLVKNEKIRDRSFKDLLTDFEECKGDLEIVCFPRAIMTKTTCNLYMEQYGFINTLQMIIL